MGHVSKNIGGLYQTPKTSEQTGSAEILVPKAYQRKALNFLQQELFTTPEWLRNPKLFSTGIVDFSKVGKIQIQFLNYLMSPAKISMIIATEQTYGPKVFTASEMLNLLKSGIFSELQSQKININMERRNLQKTYVENLVAILGPKSTLRQSDYASIAREQARTLERVLRTSIAKSGNSVTRAHIRDLADRLRDLIDRKYLPA